MDQTIEGGVQLRVTPPGLVKLSEVVRTAINSALAGGRCLPRRTVVDTALVSATICPQNQGMCTPGCHVPINIDYINMSVVGDLLRFEIQFDVGPVMIPIDWQVAVLAGTCTATADVQNVVVEADIALEINPGTGALEIHLADVRRVDLSGVNLSGCGGVAAIVDTALALVDALLGTLLGDILLDVISPTIDDVLQRLLPSPLGIEGMFDFGTPGANALIETKLLPGGSVSLPGAGLSLGIITGFNADEDVTSRSPELDSEPALCVPPFVAPDFAAPPHNLVTSSRGAFRLDLADEFLGAPDPAADVVLGVSETFLDLTGHHLVSSGALCIGVGTDLMPQLNLGLIGLLIPSLAELGTEDGDDPMLLVLRPTRPLDVTVGAGTEDDPSLTIRIEDLEVDFYAFLFERFVRGFTISLTMDVGVNLELTLNDQGDPVLEPMLVGLTTDDIELTVHNSEFLSEDTATLEQVLPSIFDLALPLIAERLAEVPLPDLVGFTLTDVSVGKVVTSQDDFLAVYALLTPSSDACGDGVARAAGAVDTVARLVDVRVPPPAAIRDWMGSRPGGELPQLELELDAYAADGRRLEFSWRLDGGFWHPYTAETPLIIAERQLGIQGHHSVEVKARAIGDQRSIDPTPAHFDFVVDSAGPRIHRRSIRVEAEQLVVTANDLVMPDDTIEFAFGVGFGAREAATEWRPDGTLTQSEAEALADGDFVTVFARDELGNVSRENIDVSGLVGFHGRAVGGEGCGCAVGGTSRGLDALIGAAIVLLLLGFRPRRTRRASARWYGRL